MKKRARFLHGIYRTIIRLILQLNYDFQVWQETELPPGPKLYCSNHFSSSDANFVTTLMPEPLHMVIGPGFGIPIVKNFLHWTEQIPALTSENKHAVVDTAVEHLKQGDSVYIFPEGRLNTIEQLDVFRAGLARIYLKNPVPIIPIGLIAPKRRVRRKQSQVAGREMTVVSKNYYANIGRPMEFPEALEIAKTDSKRAEEMIMEAVKSEVSRLIDDIKTNKFWS
ncbi:MAG: lysophospholipid acyltransferase family protein [Sphaerochaetaceae bacterium]|nr:lysophospholipid acyltransferase family protein [Sphaerochaetaceae bacterium]